MANFCGAFTSYLDQQGVKYRQLGDNVVSVGYNAKNGSFEIKLFFSEGGDGHVALRCWDIGKFEDDKYMKALIVCNEMNEKYRWVKFYMDADHAAVASDDAIVELNTVGPECLELVQRMVNICDESYPAFMKLKWA